MSQDALQRIEAKLNSVISLLAWLVVDSTDVENLYEKIQKLEDLGVDRNLIPAVLETTEKTVKSALTPSQRKKTGRKSKQKKDALKKKTQ